MSFKKINIHIRSYIFILSYKIIFKFKQSNPNKIIVLSEGRGGSTLLLDILMTRKSFLGYFEPFQYSSRLYKSKKSARLFPFILSDDEKLSFVNLIKSYNYLNTTNVIKRQILMLNRYRTFFSFDTVVYKVINKWHYVDLLLSNLSNLTHVLVLHRDPMEIIRSRYNYDYMHFQKEYETITFYHRDLVDISPLEADLYQTLKTNFEFYAFYYYWSLTKSLSILADSDVSWSVISYDDLINGKCDEVLDVVGISKIDYQSSLGKKSNSTKRFFNVEEKRGLIVLNNYEIRIKQISDFFINSNPHLYTFLNK